MATTVRKIFDLAAAILFTSKGGDTDYDQYSPLLLERLLIEALPHGLASALMIDEEDKQAQMVLEHNYFVEALEDAAPAVFAYDREEGTE